MQVSKDISNQFLCQETEKNSFQVFGLQCTCAGSGCRQGIDSVILGIELYQIYFAGYLHCTTGFKSFSTLLFGMGKRVFLTSEPSSTLSLPFAQYFREGLSKACPAVLSNDQVSVTCYSWLFSLALGFRGYIVILIRLNLSHTPVSLVFRHEVWVFQHLQLYIWFLCVTLALFQGVKDLGYFF